MSYYARVYYPANNLGETAFTVPYQYLRQEHVHVYSKLTSSLDYATELAVGVDYNWTSASTIALAAPRSNTTDLLIQRKTPADALLVEVQAGTISSAAINLENTHLLYIEQEALDAAQFNTVSLDSAIRAIAGETYAPLPSKAGQAGKVIALDGSGNPVWAALAGAGDLTLRTDLAGLTLGASLVALSGSLAYAQGTIGKTLTDVISPKMSPWLAKGDGATDDTAAVQNSLNFAIANGKKWDGGWSMYAVSGAITIASKNDVEIGVIRLKQLAPGASTSVRTLLINGPSQRFHAEFIEINRNGLGSQGSLSDAAGFYLDGGQEHWIEGCEVYGNGKGTGIAILNTFNSRYDHLFARDIAFDQPSATDDLVQGVWMVGNQGCVFNEPRAMRLTGNATVPGPSFPTRFTRGLCGAGNIRCIFNNFFVQSVDQGFDFSGSASQFLNVVNGGAAQDCASYGVKLANAAFKNTINNVVARDCGLSGFIVSGPSEAGLSTPSEGNRFNNCREVNTGSSGATWGAAIAFRVSKQTTYAGGGAATAGDQLFPKDTIFNNCEHTDDQTVATAQYGFFSDVAYDAANKKPNLLINCRSSRHTVAFSSGFQYQTLSSVRGTGTQSIPNTGDTVISFGNVDVDTLAENSVTNRYLPTSAGWRRIMAKAEFATNATGFRRIQIRKNGTNAAGSNRSMSAVAGTVSAIQTEALVYFNGTTDYVDVVVEQNSGGALNVDLTQCILTATLVQAA